MAEGKLPVITISREYGAGGRSVARALSERFGIEFYDADFVKLTSKISGFSEEDVRREGENMSERSHFINNFLNNTASYISSYDTIFQVQKEVILKLAQTPCIIVGRCSNIILREAGIPSFDVFLYASKEYRLRRTIELNDYGNMDPAKYLEKRDKQRKIYYRAYTDKELGNYEDYNICLDTSAIGKQKCIDILEDIIRNLA